MTANPNTSATGRVWLITGATSGFGLELSKAALARGDTVVAAARRTDTLDALSADHPGRLQPCRLDVTNTAAAAAAVEDVVARYGRIDVLVNGAGRTQVGAVEETTEDELRRLFELHFFGPAALTKATVAHMRRQRGGAIVQFSSMGGQMSFAGFSAYSATKFALEGLSEALADEVAPFGVKVLVVEPGAFRTNLFGKNAAYLSEPNDAYADTVGPTRDMVRTGDGEQAGDPAKAATAILTALDSDDTPLHLPLGADAVDAIRAHHDRLATQITQWENISRATAYD
ncbi:MAG: SDR family NAD(P)-dependent oxidoreductase [Nocardia sp.]|nr:SDR family NAD(P)-dependent oxidoreductase [Nocardia sp.]